MNFIFWMVASSNGILFELLIYCLIPSFSLNPLTDRLIDLDLILEDSWGIHFWTIASIEKKFQPCKAIRSPIAHGEVGRSRLHGCQDKQTSTKRLVSLNQLLITYSLLIRGDIHPCPGPGTRKPKYPCGMCNKAIRSNSKAHRM